MPGLKSEALASAVSEMFRAHNDAFAIELLGAKGSGLPPGRVQELVNAGLITPDKLAGIVVPGLENAMDPYTYIRMVSTVFEETPPEKRHELRGWSAIDWAPKIDDAYSRSWQQGALEVGGSVTAGTQPERPPAPDARMYTEEEPPDWLSPAEKYSYTQAKTRAAGFIRGLGNFFGNSAGNTVLEEWHEEDIVTEADAELRLERQEQIRNVTAEAISTHNDPGQLARDLYKITGEAERNWERIARTELQGAYNDSRVLDALDWYGEETAIARYPESGACAECIRLFVGAGGEPVVFKVQDLVGNGTNVGKKRRQWQATLWPVHPNCRCDTVVVPPGMMVKKDGTLHPLEKKT